ncbi:MAG: nucleotide sugar dehydrogenase, partial [Polyangiaceae bacterium]|nr:nucleotide sugar dehydrogenase [Polyangiaceae bacterium]
MTTLLSRIQSKQAKVAVIGLGYVGLPVAACLADAGFDVTGVDLKTDRIARIAKGECPIEGEEPGLAPMITRVVQSGKLTATTDYEKLRDADVILIDVDTPVEADNKPLYRGLRGAVEKLGAVLKE